MRLIPQKSHGPLIPVTLLTGFLGSGKTTLLNRLLTGPDGARYAVLINEFGDVPIDQHFLPPGDGVVTLPNGCLCCVAGSDMEAAMSSLFVHGGGAQGPMFKRLIIETSGLADPGPLIQTLIASPLMTRCYELSLVVATADALLAASQLDRHTESIRQIALADRIIVTKSDLQPDTDDLQARLRAINTGAQIVAGDARASDIAALLCAAPGRDAAPRAMPPPAAGHHHSPVSTITLSADAPLDWDAFDRWFRELRISHGEGLLRAKGLLAIQGQQGAVAIHAVNHVMHPPVLDNPWPGEAGCSLLVLITEGLELEAIRHGWGSLATGARPRPASQQFVRQATADFQ